VGGVRPQQAANVPKNLHAEGAQRNDAKGGCDQKNPRCAIHGCLATRARALVRRSSTCIDLDFVAV